MYNIHNPKNWPGGVGASDFVDAFLENAKTASAKNQKHSIWAGNFLANKIQTLNPTFAGT